jgi:hypothetical protein
MIRKEMGLPIKPLEFENVPAVGRVSVSSPSILRALEGPNKGNEYSDQIKPFNFLLTCHINPFGHPLGADPTRFHLISQYEIDSKKWLQQKWIDQYTGKDYRISTSGNLGGKQTARVKTLGEVIEEYEFHPESKCAHADGHSATRQTRGLLQRRHISIDCIRYIGKESNRLDEVHSGLIHSSENVYTEYKDQRRDDWETKARPAFKKVSLSVLIRCLSRRMLIKARVGKVRPHERNQRKITAALRRLGLLDKNWSGDFECDRCLR